MYNFAGILMKLPNKVANNAIKIYSLGIPILVKAKAIRLIWTTTKKNRTEKKKIMINKNVRGLKNIICPLYG
jgi:hypothetical protein